MDAVELATDEGMDQLFETCGATAVRTFREPVPVVFEDAAGWRDWSMRVGQGAMWRLVPPEEREGLFHDAASLLESARDSEGKIRLSQDVRYTLGSVH